MPTSPHLELDTPLRASTSAVATSIPGETVILDPASGRYFGLDGVGSLVWEALQSTNDLAGLIAVVTDTYEVDETTCERDLRTLIADLAAKGLVSVG